MKTVNIISISIKVYLYLAHNDINCTGSEIRICQGFHREPKFRSSGRSAEKSRMRT